MPRGGQKIAWAVLLAVTAAPLGVGQEIGKKAGRADLYGDPLPEGAVARLKALRWRYTGDVEAAVAFTADGKTLLSAGPEAFFCSWRVADGQLLWKLPDPRPPHAQHGLAVSPDGKTAALFGERGIHLWDYSRKQLLAQIEVAGGVGSAAFSPDGKLLAARHGEGAVGVYAVPSGERRQTLRGPDGAALAAAFADGGQALVTWHGKGTITFWDVDTGRTRLRHVLPGEHDDGGHVHLSADGNRLAILSKVDKKQNRPAALLVADVSAGKILHRLAEIPEGAQAPHFSPDGKTLAVPGYRVIALYDATAGRRVHVLPCGPWSGRCLAFSPDGATLAVAGPGISLWDVATGRERPAFGGHYRPVTSVSFSADGRRVVTGCPSSPGTGEDDPTVRVWEAATGRPLQILNGKEPTLGRVLFTPDGHRVLAGYADGTARVWEVDTGKESHRWPAWGDREGLIYQAQTMSLSLDGKRLTTVRWIHHGPVPCTVIQSDLVTGKELSRRRFQPGVGFGTLILTDDSRILVTMLDRSVTVNDLTAAERRFVLPIDRARNNELFSAGPVISSDGRFLAALSRDVGSDSPEPQRLHLWEVATGKTVCNHLTGTPYVRVIALSADGRFLATAGPDEMRIWDLPTGRELYRRGDLTGDVTSLAFAPDGKTLASGLRYGTVLVWDVASAIDKARSAPAPVEPQELGRLWEDLAGADALKAYQAIFRLAAVPRQALPLLRERLRPAPAADPGRLKQLLADLNSDRFAVRNKANQELNDLGDLAAPALREALDRKVTLEERRRIETLLEGTRFVRPPEALRRLRAVQVLERIDTPEARRILERLAGGADGARETSAARSAVERLARKHAGG